MVSCHLSHGGGRSSMCVSATSRSNLALWNTSSTPGSLHNACSLMRALSAVQLFSVGCAQARYSGLRFPSAIETPTGRGGYCGRALIASVSKSTTATRRRAISVLLLLVACSRLAATPGGRCFTLDRFVRLRGNDLALRLGRALHDDRQQLAVDAVDEIELHV